MLATAPTHRTHAALVLAGLLSAALPLLTGCETFKEAENPVAALVESVSPTSPREAAEMTFNPYDADKRRNGVALLSSAPFGGEKPYVTTYRTLITDDDATVRAACVRALGLHGTVEDTQIIIPRLDDRVNHVRLEAAQALQKIHTDEAVPALIQHLHAQQFGETRGEESADVRAACAYALGQYAEPRVFDALVGALNDTDFSVVHAARQSLHTLTGYDMGNDSTLWIIWAKKNEGKLFEKKQPYKWQPFDRGSTFLEDVQFWKERQVPQPQTPVGTGVSKPAEGDGKS